MIGADTVVLTHAQAALSDAPFISAQGARPEVLEKPAGRADNLRMLLDMNGAVCEVVTGVSVGACRLCYFIWVGGFGMG